MPFYDNTLNRYIKRNPEEVSLSTKPLSEILTSKYHCANCCKLIEVDITRNWMNIFYSEKYKKPIDYFALKSKKTGEWIFCFKTYYDKGFNAAIVEFWHEFHEKESKWLEIKSDLDRLFKSDSTNGIEIKNISDLNI